VRRLLTAVALAVAVAGALALVAAGGEAGGEARRYTVELDNAFGLVEGGDVKVAGVNAGRVVGLDLDRRTQKALVEVEITERGFGSLRHDVFCESRPQSPIGEYFLDCLPGTSRTELPPGSRVPLRQTASTIPPDLVQNIMRLPYRERFRLIVNEFGAGLAGRPEDLNEAIRRGVPALRQSARLLDVLADHNRVIRDLVTNADRVIGRLANNRRDVGRFVVEARDTASASAERRADIATNFRKLPRFLEELTPTMAALGEAAEEQRPVLVDLNASAGELRRFFDDSADFYDASRPALRALAEAAGPGRQAVRAARPRIRELRSYARRTPDLGRNLRITLEDFDDQGRAVERDPRSPGGRGYSGTQALLSYPFNQSLVNNAFDEMGYMVRAAAHTDHCSPYANAETAKRPDKADCRSWLGPNQPGVTTPDPSIGGGSSANAGGRGGGEPGGRDGARRRAGARGPDGLGGEGGPGGGGRVSLQRLLDGLLGGAPRPELPAPPTPVPDPHGLDGSSSLLDFLLGP
jgi:ABC-type transporter Mla subunit MlaD